MSDAQTDRAPVFDWYRPGRHDELFAPVTIFLSASVMLPERRKETRNDPVDPDTVRIAIVSLVRETLGRGWNILFGGQPQISPMLLTVAREDGVGPGRIVCFQSEYFVAQIPAATKELWQYGHVFLHPRVPGRDDQEARAASLREMREVMLGVPHLVAGVFIGGMIGVIDEASMLRKQERTNLSLYALKGTGSAAHDLFEADPVTYSGDSPRLRQLIDTSVSQSLVAKRVVEHIADNLKRRP